MRGAPVSRTAAALAQGTLGGEPMRPIRGLFSIVVDSRERHPWQPPPDVPYVVCALPSGDYSIGGYEDRVAVERKSLPDYVHSVFADWARFSAELRRLAAYDLAVVIVEATQEDVRRGKYRPSASSGIRTGRSGAWAARLDALSPGKVLASASVIHGEFGIPVLWAETAHRASTLTWAMLRAWHRTERARAGLGCTP